MMNSAADLIGRTRLASFLGMSHGGARDTYAAFGYPVDVPAIALVGMYKRNDIAHRIVSAFPKATWREMPLIRDVKGSSDDEEDADNFSPFVKSVNEFFNSRNVMRILERADRLASIGRFGTLFLGFQDGKEPHEPLDVASKPKLLFCSPYGEFGCTVANFCSDLQSPRYGMPEHYNLNPSNVDTGQKAPMKTVRAHWTRVIHIAELLDQDDVFGTPRLLPIYNRLMDLEKVVGGSAETFWITANRGIAFWADEDASLGDDEITKVKEQADEIIHGLRRTIVGQKMTAQVLGSDVPDPEPNVNTLLDLIAGAVGVPRRILVGSERGELASTQDENNWAARIDERRTTFGTPIMLMPFVQKMIDTGNILPPEGKFWVEWPDTGALGPEAEANIMTQKTNQLVAYSNAPDAQMIVPPEEFRSTFLGLDPVSSYELPAIEELPPALDQAPEATDAPADPENQPTATADGPSHIPTSNLDLVDLRLRHSPNVELVANMAPRPLCVRRQVKNAAAIIAWAKSQGIKNTEPASELHVTILYSKLPVDWLAVMPMWNEEDDGSFMVHPGGPRVLEVFGNDSMVLAFNSDGLSWRHHELCEAGGSHDFAKYQPHITIAKGWDKSADLKKIEPYRGAIALGPEIFEDIKSKED